MGKQVLSIGQCGPDHCTLSRFIESHFQATVTPAQVCTDSLDHLEKQPFDLILVNRKLDADYSDGLDVLRKIKSDERFQSIPVMLVTNYPEHQEQAVAAGAVPGFGKLEYAKPETLEKLRLFLG